MANTDVDFVFRSRHVALCRFMCLEFSRVPIQSLQKAYDWYSFNVIPAIGEVCAAYALYTLSLFLITRDKTRKATVLYNITI